MSDASSNPGAALRNDAAARARAIRHLWQLSGQPGQHRQAYLYAIIDAARDERIYPALRQLAAKEEIVSLYQGPSARELAAVAPYLVCLGTSDRVFDWLWKDGWGQDWGIFLWSLVSTSTMRDHFRRLTMVRTEANKRLLFRFYDPRVLRPFLPTCDAAQLREMFGTVVSRFMVPSSDGTSVDVFRTNAGQLLTSRFDLTGAVEPPPITRP